MTTTPDAADWLAVNRANWDERVPIHAAGSFYDLPSFVAGRESLQGFEVDEVGDVRGKSLLHLQCHIGLDTLSWARRGAVVTGLDFSPAAVAVAGELAGRVGADTARFVTADVYDAVEAVGGERFDIVYTGFGALCWLPDIAGWARTVAALVAEGGFLYLAEYHPVAELLADDGVTVESDYFRREPFVVDAPGTYADAAASMDATLTVEWRHGVGEVVSALAAAGLRVEFLHEHDRGHFRLPAGRGVPRVYSVRAAKTG
ncbi:class I SAM-dependent methyltransferase [Streptomyces acidiscabies]|uniref:Class I SAM-dependent methyltransferase n=1 Tax=Streptomyces acidiscabies TaxID=42234 RepID=A0AAP6B711_9ACTN|nr:class I SAM-dependent methyltransferase [Streptomyces acidiscabies]MBP5939693.1 class I SAM-dependent methyltransferase [Streptomyces sp. LBUM 1476]MBZ3910868.1 class I SAM-dependent methyltransferase [Streptomyces acidiscabies]MDX2959352.1 class I SAM-dependent methyltransferase [Streptomyces acidiscabies]MDX3017504.1 class I SAM-dependent methyltransferase [Streptomyces acidiscabies]MDX3787980.1 class I SAM-dependent methyltransferase [Streptomyces acidiscabies]